MSQHQFQIGIAGKKRNILSRLCARRLSNCLRHLRGALFPVGIAGRNSPANDLQVFPGKRRRQRKTGVLVFAAQQLLHSPQRGQRGRKENRPPHGFGRLGEGFSRQKAIEGQCPLPPVLFQKNGVFLVLVLCGVQEGQQHPQQRKQQTQRYAVRLGDQRGNLFLYLRRHRDDFDRQFVQRFCFTSVQLPQTAK